MIQMKFAGTTVVVRRLLKIAKEDLYVSRLLFLNNFYPHSIFYLQQSVEKIGKAFAICTNLIKVESGEQLEKELKRKIGHNLFKLFIAPIKDYQQKLEVFRTFSAHHPELKQLWIGKKILSEELERGFKKYGSFFEKLQKKIQIK